MKRKPFFLLILVLLFLIPASCRQEKPEGEGEYQLYFAVSRDVDYGRALDTQPWEGEGTPTPEQLLESLLDGPTREGLRSPFPGTVSVQSMTLDADQGMLHITLSEQYGGLTDMAQTLADACITMTMCQFPQIWQVEISSEGFWSSRPASRILTPEQIQLDTLLP